MRPSRRLWSSCARVDVRVRRGTDPVEFVHAQRRREDRELVALIAASCAFGNVTTIRAKLGELLDRIGPHPARAADDPLALAKRLAGFNRTTTLADIGDAAGLRQRWAGLTLTRQEQIVAAVLDHLVVGPARRGYNRFDPARLAPVWRG